MSRFTPDNMPEVINFIVPFDGENQLGNQGNVVVATRNERKIEEFKRILGVKVIGKDLKVVEIQGDPLQVLEAKAIEAWRQNNGRPILVEDTSLIISALNGMPGPFVDQLLGSNSGNREIFCQALKGGNRGAVFQVGIAVFDGYQVHTRIGTQSGTIAETPRGAFGFGFDDIFEPDGQTDDNKKTYAEMSEAEKDELSPRKKALEKFLTDTINLNIPVFELPPPYEFQMDAIHWDELNQNPKALQFAYMLEALAGQEPNPDFQIDGFSPFCEQVLFNGAIRRFVVDPDSSSQGLLVTPIDTSHNLKGEPTRLEADQFGNLIFWQMGIEETRKALAARANEFLLFHNDDMYEYLRAMMRGEIETPKRENRHSKVIEKMIHLIRREEDGEDTPQEEWDVLVSAASSEVGYARQSSDEYMSRTSAAHKGLILNNNGIPSSLFELGGMPPVTAWKDVIVTAALSYMRSWIPHNSAYAENPDLQLQLFHDAVKDIDSLQLPQDIRDLVVAQIGISVGCENPDNIAAFAKRAYDEGLRAIRIYTTNPDPRVVETALAIRQACPDIFLCVGPVVDMAQAKRLVQSDIKVNLILWGHGAGENCTSLAGGGAANALELLYLSSIDPAFNDTEIGVEGGTGWSIGPLLGFIDKISYDQRLVAGGIELGGLFVEHSDGTAVQPYHGSASSVTQWLEALFNKKLADKRLTLAGDLKNVEGKPNYMEKLRSIATIVQHFWNARMYGGRALADQRSHNINEMRNHVNEHGYRNLRSVTPESGKKAKSHRRSKE